VSSAIPTSADEWRAILEGTANVLIEGPAPWTEAIVGALVHQLQHPFVEWRRSPPRPAPSGPVVVPAVHGFDSAAQGELLQWMNSADRRCPLRLLTTSHVPLFPLVEDGRFLRNLYYRLNMILIREIDFLI
jgi:hypothetical protein